MFSRISPTKGVVQFEVKDKLGFIEISSIAYRSTLSPSLTKVHNMFYIFPLRNFIQNPNQVIKLEQANIQAPLSIVEYLDIKVVTKE